MTLYALADRFSQPDVRLIAQLPPAILTHWLAYLRISSADQVAGSEPSSIPTPTMPDDTFLQASTLDAQCAAVASIMS
ncbi:hypothetical protein [Plesiomonas shigelloides]|uniref:hypothetical protein n=1 Tax=Plesiomonas shigelloides TaxID=703 RepID=UPI0012617D36|nr:hypothetical protein [Plesiomonas shigelloides]KAB7669773.1 hypothetical protein GBN18_06285 [Plesiomonas shigelloides]KAB7692621.1 hypothetical protein GBN24_05730 [Plesiomonas shigelloides]KAB7700997.1 hypothetical protein GBN33_05005 [Plesiomonas shigelloides]MBW3794400.1 hypothetical protein [Plesiomonas shigelloides]MCQ8858227.1 hypothetical protein [Plesiomonas shigelloides]